MKLQDLLKEKKIIRPVKKKGGIHSEVQSLAVELSEYFGEKDKIGMYLGIVKRKGVERCRRVWSEVKDAGNRDSKINEVKLFFYKLKNK